MRTPNTTIELPKDLFNRLKAAARAEKVDPVTLIENLLQRIEPENHVPAEKETPLAPLYRIHEYAIDMGVTDLAQNFDHYLYNLEKDENSK